MKQDPKHNYAQAIWQIMHMVKLQLDDKLAPYGITSRQARLLAWVELRNAQGLSVRQKDLEQDMGLRASSVTSLIQGLERNGFITRFSGRQDARTKTLALTPKSQKLLSVFQGIFQSAEEAIVCGMSEGQRQTFWELMGIALSNLGSQWTSDYTIPS